MGKILIRILLGLVLLSCNKDKVHEPCKGVEMEGEKSKLIGKWVWYLTIVEEWFDVGPSIYHDYNPQNQGFEYYFTISQDGIFQGYRNDSLIDFILLSSVEFENFQNSPTYAIEFVNNCDIDRTSLYQNSWNTTNDSIFSLQYPLNFNNEVNHLRSKINYFVKE